MDNGLGNGVGSGGRANLEKEGLRTEDVSRISFELLDAVNHCAKHGIIHRDIKVRGNKDCHVHDLVSIKETAGSAIFAWQRRKWK